jgi:hypothetical protein
MDRASNNIAPDGTYRVTIRWSRPVTLSGDPVWQNRSAWDGGVRHPVKDRSRSDPKPRQQRNRDLGGEEGREQRRPDRGKIRSGQTTLITIQ